MTDLAPGAPPVRRRPAVARRGRVADFEAGERTLASRGRLLGLVAPALLPLTSLVCVDTDERVVALTYDDGPDPEFTPQVLDALAAAGARATFFVLVERVEKYPEIVRRIVEEGHEVALHGIDHARLAVQPPKQAVAVIREGRDRLEQALGAPVTRFRPTYGAQSVGQFAGTRRLGLEVVIWSAWARDWEGGEAAPVAERTIGALHPGAFVLLHDCSGDGVGLGLERGEVTRRVLAGMAESGWTSRTVGDLVAGYPEIRAPWAQLRPKAPDDVPPA